MQKNKNKAPIICHECKLQFPLWEWDFVLLDDNKYECYFVVKSDKPKAMNYSLSYGKNEHLKEDQEFMYFRNKTCEKNKYLCPECFTKTEKHLDCQRIDQEIAERGRIVLLSSDLTHKTKIKVPQKQKIITLQNSFGSRLQGGPDNSVFNTNRNGDWQSWALIHLQKDRFLIQSIHGSYLRVHPDYKNRVTLQEIKNPAKPPRQSIWQKIDQEDYFYLSSCYGTALRSWPNSYKGKVDLTDKHGQWEMWWC